MAKGRLTEINLPLTITQEDVRSISRLDHVFYLSYPPKDVDSTQAP
jgi:hypothetical protein